MDVEAVHGVDSECENFFGVSFHAASWSGEDGNLHIVQFLDVFDHGIFLQFFRAVLCSFSSDDAGDFKVRCCFQCLERVVSDVSVANDGCTNLFHFVFVLC